MQTLCSIVTTTDLTHAYGGFVAVIILIVMRQYVIILYMVALQATIRVFPTVIVRI